MIQAWEPVAACPFDRPHADNATGAVVKPSDIPPNSVTLIPASILPAYSVARDA
jgi:hypothetical protein